LGAIVTTDKSKTGGKGGKPPVSDRDAIDALPLSMIPLSSGTLKSARLVKNSRMETAVELHSDSVSGSLQIRPEDIVQAQAGTVEDQAIVSKLSALPSYDIYSLRSSLKRLGIEVDDTVLELSGDMKDTLHRYTQEFTRPLIRNIFGEGDETDADLLKLFNDPDKTRVAGRLKMMGQKTGLGMAEIPAFLEDYSDVFLSVAYYRHTFHGIVPDINRFWLWLGDLRTQREVASSPRTLASCKKVEDSLRFLSTSIRERLAKFQNGFELFWGDINKQSFMKLRSDIEENHAGMGAVLCGLVVKTRNWSLEFPDNAVGGPQKRAQYVITELEPGLEQLKLMENEARSRIGLTLVHIF
jgi:hypothetical protein